MNLKLKGAFFALFFVFVSVILGVDLSILPTGFAIVRERVQLSVGSNVVKLFVKPDPKLVFMTPDLERVNFLNESVIRVDSDAATQATLLYFTKSFTWKAYHLLDLSGDFQSVAVINSRERFKGNVFLCWGVYQDQFARGQFKAAIVGKGEEVLETTETLRCLELGETGFDEDWNEFSLLKLSTAWKRLNVLETFGDVKDQPLKARAVAENVLSMDLPPGDVYVFDRGVFAGIARLEGMSKGQRLEVTYGNAYDVRGSRITVEEKRLDSSTRQKLVRFSVRNYGSETREVVVVDHVPIDSRVVASELPFERPTAGTVVFRFVLDAGAEFAFEYQVEYHQR